MENWGSSGSVAASANSTSYVASSSYNIVIDNFTALQPPRKVNTSRLGFRPALNTGAGASLTVGAPFNISNMQTLGYRSSITYQNAESLQIVNINRRPNRGQVYPRY